MKKILFIVLLLLGTGFCEQYHAQSGGKKREKRVKTKKRGNHILTQYKSRGHADEFANGSIGRRGKIARLFHKAKPSWTNRRSGSKRSHNRENRDLFARERQKGHVSNSEIQSKNRIDRARSRDYGNRSFKRKKYNRK